MRIAFYDPYLNTLGGGERYVLTAAECLSEKHDVEVFWDSKEILEEAEKKFNLNLKTVNVVDNIFNKKLSTIGRINRTKVYDVIFYLSDGSIPLLSGQKNILLFQHPVNWVKGKSITTRIKFASIHEIICYSEFVKGYLDKTFPKKAKVIYPPVDLLNYEEVNKKNIILTVGRFTKAMNAKKQEVLIEAFKQMCDEGLTKWELVVAGSYLKEDEDFVEQIKKQSQGYPIKIIANASFAQLQDLYKRAKIYWHATGYGEDIENNPERTEHFGITTVEAMSAGAVPVVFKGGGQTEIVADDNGFTWKTVEELQNKTNMLIENNGQRLQKVNLVVNHAKDFSKDHFIKAIEKLILNN